VDIEGRKKLSLNVFCSWTAKGRAGPPLKYLGTLNVNTAYGYGMDKAMALDGLLVCTIGDLDWTRQLEAAYD
jgi:hypothetical protein